MAWNNWSCIAVWTSSLLETMVKLCFFFVNRIESLIMFLMVQRKGRNPFSQNPRSCSSPLSPFHQDGESYQTMTQTRRWPEVTPSSFWSKPGTSSSTYSLPTEIFLLLKRCRQFAWYVNIFFYECHVLDNNTPSLIAISPKGVHKVYETKKINPNMIRRQRHKILVKVACK